MIGSVAQTALNITDTAFLGRVGEIEMDASSIGGVLYFVLVMIGMALGIGSQIMIARKSGEKKENEIGSIFDQSLLLMIIFSILIFFIIEYVSPVFLGNYLKSKEVINQTNLFLHYRAFGIFFVMIAVAYRSFYVGIAETRIITYSSFVMAGVNIILDYFLIFGKGGFPKMGIEGAAIASSTAELCGAMYYIFYTYFKRVNVRFLLLRFNEFNKKSIAKILNLSAPIMLQHLFSMGGWFIFFMVIERMGEHELAISTVIRNTLIVIMMPIWSYFTATNSMVSNIIGQGRSDHVFPLLKKIISFSIITIIIIITATLLFPDFILGISTSDMNLIHDSRNSLMVICIASFMFSYSSILLSAVSGTGATKAAMIIEFLTIFIYLGYLYMVVTKLKSTVEVAWCAEILYWLLMSIMSFIYLKSNRWKSIKI